MFCCLKFTRVQLYKLLSESYFTIPLYSFTMHSLRGTLSVGWADRFSLWVVFYVYDEWFMGKLRGSLDFLHTMIKHYKQIFGTKRTSYILVTR